MNRKRSEKVDFTEMPNLCYFPVANPQLRGTDVVQQAQVIQWLDFADGAILPPSSRWVFPLLGIVPFNKQVLQRKLYFFK